MRTQLPDGYVDLDRGSVRIVATRLALHEMVDLLEHRHDPIPPAEVAGGRGGTRRIALAGGKTVYLRHYLRGGAMRRLSRDRYLLRPPRPLRELIVTEWARACGCPVPTVAAVCVEEAGLFYRGWIVTEAIDDTCPFIETYAEAAASERRGLLKAAGRAIRSIHDAGIYHRDLNGHNLLVDDDGRVWIIDFDRALLAQPGVARRAQRGLDRLWRSLEKLTAVRGMALARDERRWLERGYAR